tara:strand:+ start:858 stop:1259 length:402 start_codon:yes stop_codon:yes gene_type:complete
MENTIKKSTNTKLNDWIKLGKPKQIKLDRFHLGCPYSHACGYHSYTVSTICSQDFWTEEFDPFKFETFVITRFIDMDEQDEDAPFAKWNYSSNCIDDITKYHDDIILKILRAYMQKREYDNLETKNTFFSILA